jgi:very-short-patch-repair endonuclease
MNAAIEHGLARLATRQHGIVTREQLLGLGLSPSTVDRWARIGRLHRVHRGIYAVGHTATRRQASYVAAVLAAGPGAALSHVSAAAWWEIRPWSHGRIHIIVPTANGRSGHRGVNLHRARTLRPNEVTTHDGLAVTTVARTLLDLTATQPRHITDRAVEVATSRRLVHADVHDVIAAHPNAPNKQSLIELLAYHGDSPHRRRSDFEAYVVDLCRTHGIPLPQTDVPLLGEVVDAYWPEYRVVAEPDGMTWHGTRAAARRDRKKDGERIAHGIITVRITDEMAQQDGRATAAAIRGAMRR